MHAHSLVPREVMLTECGCVEGAWYVTPKKWSPGMGREAFELPESQDALQAMKEKKLNDKVGAQCYDSDISG